MSSPTTPIQFSPQEYQSSLQELWERLDPFNSSQDSLIEEAEKEGVEPFRPPQSTQSPHEEAEKEALLEPFQLPLASQLQYAEVEKEVALEPIQSTLPTQAPREEAERESHLRVAFSQKLRLDIPPEPTIINPASEIPWSPNSEQVPQDKLIIGVDVQVFVPKNHTDAPYPDFLKDPMGGILWYPTSDDQHHEVIPGVNFLPSIRGSLSSRIPVTEPVEYPHVLIHSATGINWVPARSDYYRWRSSSAQNYPFYASSIARTSSLAPTSIALNPIALASPSLSLASISSLASRSTITSRPQTPGASPTYQPSRTNTSPLALTPIAPRSASTSGIVSTLSSASISSPSSTSTNKRQREHGFEPEPSMVSTSSPVPTSPESGEASASSSESMSTLTTQSTSVLPTNEPSTDAMLSLDSTFTPPNLERVFSSASTLISDSASTIQREREREFTYEPSLNLTPSYVSTSAASSAPKEKKSFARKVVPERYYRGWKWRMSGSDPNSKWLSSNSPELPPPDYR